MKESKNKYTVEELLKYKETIASCIEGDRNFFVLNDSAVHASIIVEGLLSHAKVINMYCGKFSIFRDRFYQKVFESIKEKNVAFNPYETSIDALVKFLENQNSLNVIIANEDSDIHSITTDAIWSKIKKYVGANLNFFQRKDASDNLNHFMVADAKGYRYESDKIERTAIFNYNDPEQAKVFNELFLILKDESEALTF